MRIKSIAQRGLGTLSIHLCQYLGLASKKILYTNALVFLLPYCCRPLRLSKVIGSSQYVLLLVVLVGYMFTVTLVAVFGMELG